MQVGASLRRITMLIVLVAAGCAGGGDSSGFVERDSAGIKIAESAGPVWRDGEGWRVDSEPTVEIGTVAGEPEYELDAVSGATRLADGHIVIADGGAMTVRWYDASGRFLLSRGGEGEAPDEFQRIASLVRLDGARIGVYDSRRRVIAVFDSAAARTDIMLGVALTSGGSPAVLPDGRWVVWESAGSGSVLENPEGRDTVFLVVVAPADPIAGPQASTLATPAADTLSRYPGTFRKIIIDRDIGGDITSIAITRPAYAGGAWLAARDSQILVGDALEHALDVLAPDGTRLRIIRWSGPDLQITDAVRAEYRAAREAEYRADPDNPFANDEPGLRAALDNIGFPAVRPSYVGMLYDPAGNIWLRLDKLPGEETERHLVLDPSGRQLGTVTMPTGLRALEIGEDYVLGLWLDELDVQQVRLHRLDRGVPH